jgi:PAP2 superfamily
MGDNSHTCDKRNLRRLIALALAAMFALAGSAATAQSSLTGENAREMQRLLAVPAGTVVVTCTSTPSTRTPADTLDRFLTWNEIALDTTAIDHTPDAANPGCFGEQLGPPRTARALAIVHIAMFDAENAITKKYVSYSGIPSVSGNVSLDRAIAQAAHDTLVALYPGQKARLDAIFDADISSIHGTDDSIDAGRKLGKRAAAAILELRENDGSALPEPRWFVDYFPIGYPKVQPGIWQIDPISNLQIALGGNWGEVTPFVMTSADQFRAPEPPSVTSDAYTQAFKEVKPLGGDPAHDPNLTTSRTPQQTYIAKFWAYDGTPKLCAPPRMYNQITRTIALQQKMLGVPDIVRLFALVNVALADAGIASWETKFFYQYWRPITGIRNAVQPLVADPTYYPLGAQDTNTAGPDFTPPFPSYTSGHATFGGALFQILRQFWPDATPFTFVSDEWNGKNEDDDPPIMDRPYAPQTFTSFSEAEFQNGESRIYMGIHWGFDRDQGIIQGNRVADYVFAHAFLPAVQMMKTGP